MKRHVFLARWAWMSISAFALLMIGLHVLRPDLEPSKRMISEYAVGEYGFVMTVAFFTWAASCLLLCLALWPHVTTKVGRIGTAMLLVAATGLVLAAVFETDPMTTPEMQRTVSGRIHEIGATLDLTLFAAVLLPLGLRRNQFWQRDMKLLWLLAVLVWAGQLVFIGSMVTYMHAAEGNAGHDTQIGWAGRFMLAMECLWIFVVARIAEQRSANGV